MYDTNTKEIIGAFCYHTPVFVFALASGAEPFRLIIGDMIRERKLCGLLERDAENLVKKLFLWDRLDGGTKLNFVTVAKR